MSRVWKSVPKDMRGLTSHARHMHDISKDELLEILNKSDEKSENILLKVLGGVGAVVLTIIIIGNRGR